jgi:hypothetical protein
LNKLLGADQQNPNAGTKDSSCELTLAALTGGRNHLNLDKFQSYGKLVIDSILQYQQEATFDSTNAGDDHQAGPTDSNTELIKALDQLILKHS